MFPYFCNIGNIIDNKLMRWKYIQQIYMYLQIELQVVFFSKDVFYDGILDNH